MTVKNSIINGGAPLRRLFTIFVSLLILGFLSEGKQKQYYLTENETKTLILDDFIDSQPYMQYAVEGSSFQQHQSLQIETQEELPKYQEQQNQQNKETILLSQLFYYPNQSSVYIGVIYSESYIHVETAHYLEEYRFKAGRWEQVYKTPIKKQFTMPALAKLTIIDPFNSILFINKTVMFVNYSEKEREIYTNVQTLTFLRDNLIDCNSKNPSNSLICYTKSQIVLYLRAKTAGFKDPMHFQMSFEDIVGAFDSQIFGGFSSHEDNQITKIVTVCNKEQDCFVYHVIEKESAEDTYHLQILTSFSVDTEGEQLLAMAVEQNYIYLCTVSQIYILEINRQYNNQISVGDARLRVDLLTSISSPFPLNKVITKIQPYKAQAFALTFLGVNNSTKIPQTEIILMRRASLFTDRYYYSPMETVLKNVKFQFINSGQKIAVSNLTYFQIRKNKPHYILVYHEQLARDIQIHAFGRKNESYIESITVIVRISPTQPEDLNILEFLPQFPQSSYSSEIFVTLSQLFTGNCIQEYQINYYFEPYHLNQKTENNETIYLMDSSLFLKEDTVTRVKLKQEVIVASVYIRERVVAVQKYDQSTYLRITQIVREKHNTTQIKFYIEVCATSSVGFLCQIAEIINKYPNVLGFWKGSDNSTQIYQIVSEPASQNDNRPKISKKINVSKKESMLSLPTINSSLKFFQKWYGYVQSIENSSVKVLFVELQTLENHFCRFQINTSEPESLKFDFVFNRESVEITCHVLKERSIMAIWLIRSIKSECTKYSTLETDKGIKQINIDPKQLRDYNFWTSFGDSMLIGNETIIRKFTSLTIPPQPLFSIKISMPQVKGYETNDNFLTVYSENTYHIYDISGQKNSIQVTSGKGQITPSVILFRNQMILISLQMSTHAIIHLISPRLSIGPFNYQPYVYRINLRLKIIPKSSYNSSKEPVFQSGIMSLVFENNKLNLVGRVAQSYQVPYSAHNLEIPVRARMFWGPVANYYLSDTFDDQIQLKTYMEETLIGQKVHTLQLKSIFGGNNLLSPIQYTQSKYVVVYNETKVTVFQYFNNQTTQAQSYFKELRSYELQFNIDKQCKYWLKQGNQQQYFWWILVCKANLTILKLSPNGESRFETFQSEGEILEWQVNPISQNEQMPNWMIYTHQQLQSKQLSIVVYQSSSQEGKISLQEISRIQTENQILSIIPLQQSRQTAYLLALDKQHNLHLYQLSQNTLSIRSSISVQDIIPPSQAQNYQYMQLVRLSQILGGQNQDCEVSFLLISQNPKNMHAELTISWSNHITDWSANKNKQIEPVPLIAVINNLYAGYRSNLCKGLRAIKRSQTSLKVNTFAQHHANIGEAKKYEYFVVEYEQYEYNETLLIFYPFNSHYEKKQQIGNVADSQLFQLQKGNSGLAVSFLEGESLLTQAATLKLNSSLYFILNYFEPPKVTYIVLHGQNPLSEIIFYNKFLFGESQSVYNKKMIGCFIGFAFVVLAILLLFILNRVMPRIKSARQGKKLTFLRIQEDIEENNRSESDKMLKSDLIQSQPKSLTKIESDTD